MTPVIWFWLILGALLILSELFLPGLVAIFFGAGALLVGIALAIGLIESTAEQLLMFSIFSVAALLLAREKIRVWLRGRVSDRWAGDQDPMTARGRRVTVTRAFKDGHGTVRLSGAEWSAESEDEPGDHAVGATVWVTGHRGITLTVTAREPDPS